MGDKNLERFEITPTMIRAGVDALLDTFPEEVVSWRTTGKERAICTIYAAMEEARASATADAIAGVHISPELAK
jgi:hypothetical protein